MRTILLVTVSGLVTPAAALPDIRNYPVEVLSVIPRSPDVKPLVMSVPAAGRQKPRALEGNAAKPSDIRTARLLTVTEAKKNTPAATATELAGITPQNE